MKIGSAKAFVLRNRTVGVLAVLLAVLALYGTTADLRLFADDYISWTTVKSSLDQPWWTLLTVFYNPEFYRPFDHLLIRCNIQWLGDDPFLYRWATIFGHMLTVLAVYWLTRRFGFTRAAAMIGATYFGWSHANAMAALSNDAASQVYTVFCGTLALGFAWRKEGRPLRLWEIAASAGWLFGALMWKDAGVSYIPALGLLLLHELRLGPPERRLTRAAALAAPQVVVLALYFAMRLHSGASGPSWCGSGRYDLCFGTNIIENIGLFVLGLITPVGSSILVLRLGSTFFLACWAVSLLAMAVLWGSGLVVRFRADEAERKRLIILILLMFVVMLPDVLMNRVSELYLYKPNVFFAVLFGLSVYGLIGWWSAPRRRALLVGLVVLLVALAWVQGKSVEHKVQRMRTSGLWAARLMHEIQAQVPELPSRRIIATNRDPGPAPFYSIYYMEGIYVLGGGKIFEFYYGVPIEDYRYCDWEKLDETLRQVPGRKVILRYWRDHVRVEVADGAENPFDEP